MYNHLANSNNKRHRPRKLLTIVKKHQVKLRQDDHSKFVTGKRLSSKHSGIFSRGQISSTVLRDTIFKEDIKARAEANLSKILQLARGGSSKPESLFADNIEDGYLASVDSIRLPELFNDVDEVKHLNQVTAKPQLENVEVITRLSSQEGIERKKEGSSKANSEQSSDGIPYREFAMQIKLHLNQAKDALKNKYDIDLIGELTDLLQDTIKNKRMQLTPPSGGKGISYYLKNAAKKELDNNEIVARQREARTLFTSSSSSGISPNFDATIFSPSKFSSPLGVIRHYERNLVKHAGAADKKSFSRLNHKTMSGQQLNTEITGYGSQMNITWLRSENKENAKLLTPVTITSNQIQIPKTVLIDPAQYLERYEKSTELNGVNNNNYKENIFQLATVNAMSNTNIHNGIYHQHRHIPLNSTIKDKHINNINEHGNYDSLNKNETLSMTNKCDHVFQSQYINKNSVSKAYSEQFPLHYQHPAVLPHYVSDNIAPKICTEPFLTTPQPILPKDHQLQLDYRPFQEPFHQVHQRPIFDNTWYRSKNQHFPKERLHNNRLSFSQIVNSRDIASPNLFSPAKSHIQSHYGSRSSQTSVSKPLYHHINTQHPLCHLSSGFNSSNNLLQPLIIQESNVRNFQNQSHCQALPENIPCENNFPRESTFSATTVSCDRSFVTNQQHGPLLARIVPFHSAQPIYSPDLINYGRSQNWNGENHSEVPSSTSQVFSDLIDFCS